MPDDNELHALLSRSARDGAQRLRIQGEQQLTPEASQLLLETTTHSQHLKG